MIGDRMSVEMLTLTYTGHLKYKVTYSNTKISYLV